ncbi:hypothetical protein FACS189485_20870 [Spirochaetia bacterium]|nr:hypothetical protein FACS189485_20870 [Spirochaetia bacterium]
MASININGNQFVYEEIKLSYDTISPLDTDTAKALLLKIKEIFDKHKLDFYLAYGTLLGAVRDKGFIKGDEDIDIYITDEEKLLSIIPELHNNDIKLFRYKKKYCSFIYTDRCYIDIYFLKPYKFSFFGLYCLSLAGYATPKKYFKETEEIEFLDALFKCQKSPQKILQFWYGKTWNVPIRGHKGYPYEVYLSIFYKKFKRLVKLLIGYKYWKNDKS